MVGEGERVKTANRIDGTEIRRAGSSFAPEQQNNARNLSASRWATELQSCDAFLLQDRFQFGVFVNNADHILGGLLNSTIFCLRAGFFYPIHFYSFYFFSFLTCFTFWRRLKSNFKRCTLQQGFHLEIFLSFFISTKGEASKGEKKLKGEKTSRIFGILLYCIHFDFLVFFVLSVFFFLQLLPDIEEITFFPSRYR